MQAGKAKPRETHKTYEGWWHHGGPRWEGGRRCWGPGTRIGNRLLRERKVIGPRMGTEMGFCGREAERVRMKKQHKVESRSPSPVLLPTPSFKLALCQPKAGWLRPSMPSVFWRLPFCHRKDAEGSLLQAYTGSSQILTHAPVLG